MSLVQAINPTPNVYCTPGYCLRYDQDAFHLVNPAHRETEAIFAWRDSTHKHVGVLPPKGIAVPGFATISDNVMGHVFLFETDGSIYSSSSPTSHLPVHHPSLAALIQYYGKDAKGRTRLTYLGWTEDLEGTLVVKPAPTKQPAKKLATVTGSIANVRAAATTQSKITSQLHKGDKFYYDKIVTGQSVNGNNKWYHSVAGHYVSSTVAKG